VSSNVPVLFHLKIRDVFLTVFFFSQREHCIFQEGVDWYHKAMGALQVNW